MEQHQPNEDCQSIIEYDAIMKRLSDDQELFKDFIEIFLEDSPQHLKAFNAGLSDENPEQTRRAAHALKGLASNFGAQEFCRAAQEIETSAAAGELKLCHDRQQRLSILLKRLTEELESYR